MSNATSMSRAKTGAPAGNQNNARFPLAQTDAVYADRQARKFYALIFAETERVHGAVSLYHGKRLQTCAEHYRSAMRARSRQKKHRDKLTTADWVTLERHVLTSLENCDRDHQQGTELRCRCGFHVVLVPTPGARV